MQQIYSGIIVNGYDGYASGHRHALFTLLPHLAKSNIQAATRFLDFVLRGVDKDQ